MAETFKQAILGRTSLKVGRLGLAGSYGAPAQAYEAAFENGCNYFYTGSGRKRSEMKKAIRTLAGRGLRDRMVVSVQTYARFGFLTEYLFRKSLDTMGIDYADILMLGWHNSPPSERLMGFAVRMKEKRLCRHIGMSGHNRSLFARLARDSRFDVFHVRYNPAHRGAQTECFPAFEAADSPGLVTYTATRWGQLLAAKHMPAGEAPLSATDCYRFSLSDPRINICLCGPKTIGEMNTALAALDAGPLSETETGRIIRIGDHVHDHGGGFFS